MVNTEINSIITKDFTTKYSEFIFLGSILYKTNQQDLLKEFFNFKELKQIKVDKDTTYKFIKAVFSKQSSHERYQSALSEYFEITSQIFEYLLDNSINKLTTKQYFEAMPWAYSYANMNVKYYIIQQIAQLFFKELKVNREINALISDAHKFSTYKKANNLQNFTQFLLNFLETPEVRNFIGYIQDYKLDFSGSGQILISILINDPSFLDFAGVHKIDINFIGGYDKILKVFKERYEQNSTYVDIENLLNLIQDSQLREGVRNIIFSRSLVKNDLMVKGYSGTKYGSALKIENRIKDYLIYNAYNIYFQDYNLVKQIGKTSHKIAVELDKIIEELCPMISKRYLKLMNSFVADIKKTSNKDNGILIVNPIVTFNINPKEKAVIQIKLTRINEKTKKLLRDSRRKISYYTPETNFRKLKSSLGADIIQSFDAVVAYYIKRICKMLNPKLYIATIFDAFIFSQHLDINTFRNICRLACQLAMKPTFVNNILCLNNLPSNDFYASFDKNIFDSVDNNVLEKIIENDFIYYVINNQSQWFKELKDIQAEIRLNTKFFVKSIKYLSGKEKLEYEKYIENMLKRPRIKEIHKHYTVFGKPPQNREKLPDIKMLKDIEVLEESYKVKFVLQKIINALQILHENFYNITSNSVMHKLLEIMNNDDFIK